MTTIKMTFGALAIIAEKSPGYSVAIPTGEITNIRYERTASGRRDRRCVWATCTQNGRTSEELFFASTEVAILD